MSALAKLIDGLGAVNALLLKWGRGLGFVAMLLMVICILLQIFFRYVLNNALPWPEEAARALMIWMMALVAPSAYRHAGFVAIELIPDMLAPRIRAFLVLAILALATLVLWILLGHAWAHYSAPLLFDSSGLNRLLQDSGINQLLGTNIQFRTAYITFAMCVMLVLLLMVSLELILRQIGRIIWGAEAFSEPVLPVTMQGN